MRLNCAKIKIIFQTTNHLFRIINNCKVKFSKNMYICNEERNGLCLCIWQKINLIVCFAQPSPYEMNCFCNY